MVSLLQQQQRLQGHEVTIFTIGPPHPDDVDDQVIRAAGFPLANTGYYYRASLPRPMRTMIASVDLLHVHHLGMTIDFAHRYGRAPIIFTNHTRNDLYAAVYLHHFLPFLPQRWMNKLAAAAMRHGWSRRTAVCDMVVAPSPTVAEVMREHGVCVPIHHIPNGIDLPMFQNAVPVKRSTLEIPQDAIVAIYVGRLAREKNSLALLDSFALALEKQTRLHLLLVGTGPLKRMIRTEIRHRRIDHAVTVHGAVTPKEVPALLKAADLFVTASESEVHPLTLIEALAAGLPIVAYRAAGITDTLPAAACVLTEPTPQALAAGLLSLITCPRELQQLAVQAHEQANRYDISHTAEQYTKLYRSLTK